MFRAADRLKLQRSYRCYRRRDERSVRPFTDKAARGLLTYSDANYREPSMATGVSRSSNSRSAVWILALSLGAPAYAGTLRVTVVDDHGQPLGHVAVYALPSKAPAGAASGPNAIMDQAHNAFVPHVLIVQTGTSVLFPNNDVVSHHVYSFSEPKAFELPLYKGNAHPPIVFDRPGVVVLGCNIHDSMLGYILVVDTPHFAATDAQGMLSLDALPAGDYSLHVWTPRLRDNAQPAPRSIEVAADGTQNVSIKIEGKLQPDFYDRERVSSLPWERY
jgi:plastocyanin